MVELERWKRAVIHLEGAADTTSLHERRRQWLEQGEKLEAGLITDEEYHPDQYIGRDLRYQGTATFLEHEGQAYLITARHVVHDQKAAKHDLEEQKRQLERRRQRLQEEQRWSEEERQQFLARLTEREREDRAEAVERSREAIFDIIFRVPSLDEVERRGKVSPGEFLMNLGAGTPKYYPYTFSNQALDLAIISLREDPDFTEALQTQGYQPISLSDITDEPSSEGTDVFTVGFPAATSVLRNVTLPILERNWRSAAVSLPVSTFGRVSMLHHALDYFWCDLSIYPGNSGGPVIENGKLVGIVSEQASLGEQVRPNNSISYIRIRIPFAKVIKAKNLHPLIEEQRQKDAREATLRSSANSSENVKGKVAQPSERSGDP